MSLLWHKLFAQKVVEIMAQECKKSSSGWRASRIPSCAWLRICTIECFYSRGQHLCKFIGTKESLCIRKKFNSHRIGLGHQHGRRFIVLGHQYGRRDVMWKTLYAKARQRGRQNGCVWQTWQGYFVGVLWWSSPKLMFSNLLQKDLFRGGWSSAEKFFKQNFVTLVTRPVA